MAKKTVIAQCSRCDTPFRAQSSFCPTCGFPTPWATHDERVAYEVRQWRASRSRVEQDSSQVMLVRTDNGYEPVQVQPESTYVWDQPLHQERESHRNHPHSSHRTATATAATPAPAMPAAVEHANGDGHANGHAAGNGHAAEAVAAPAPGPVADAEPAPPVLQTTPGVEPQVLQPYPEPVSPAVEGDRVTVSRKAIVVGLALVIGLPIGSVLLGAGRDAPRTQTPAAGGAVAPAQGARPTALVGARYGFQQIGPDTVRYAVVIRNPNRSLAATGVNLTVWLKDAAGRLVGTDRVNVPLVPAGASLGVAEAVGVSGTASRLYVSLATGAFEAGLPGRPFTVGTVRVLRPAPDRVTVRANVSGISPAKGARVVAVHLDRAGRVVGGDFTIVDVPRSPNAVTAEITTANVHRSIARVEIYIIAPR